MNSWITISYTWKIYKEFEKEYAVYSDSKYCLGVGNGLDALTLLLSALE